MPNINFGAWWKILVVLLFALALGFLWKQTHPTSPTGTLSKAGGDSGMTAQIQRVRRLSNADDSAQQAELLGQLQKLKGHAPQIQSRSGLDMITPPASKATHSGTSSIDSAQSALSAPGGLLQNNPASVSDQVQNLAQGNNAILASIMPILNNPQVTSGMPPDQVQQFNQLKNIILQMQSKISKGQSMSPEQETQMRTTIQKIMASMQPPAGANPASAPPLPASDGN
jgi:hypothetical protein